METFTLNEEQWQEFNELLEAPAREMPKLKAMMEKPEIWAEEEK
jgi:uncharacterized protein (DUF1778 family)